MPVTWDPKPFPKELDWSARRTFYGVGLVMSHWESLEFELARLYSFFVEDPDGEAMQTGYGAGTIFTQRLAALRKAACKKFIRIPSQSVEGLFDRLTAYAEDLSIERNNVAHGIVFNVSKFEMFKARFPDMRYGLAPRFALIPPLYTLRRHAGGLPTYAYALGELRELAHELLSLSVDVQTFREALADLSGQPATRS